jgi:hypothetical protein
MRCSDTRACADRAKGLGRAEDTPAPNADMAAKLKANPWAKDPPAAAAAASQPQGDQPKA